MEFKTIVLVDVILIVVVEVVAKREEEVIALVLMEGILTLRWR